jgi:2-iminobutanoate/2-iminopropanoate deaminase
LVKQIQSQKAPKAVALYSQAVTVNGFAFLSGMLPLDVNTGDIIGITAGYGFKRMGQHLKMG